LRDFLVLENLSNQNKEINLAHISAAKRDLLAKYLRGELAEEFSSNTIPRRAPDASLRLSFSQERLWFLDHLMPGSPVFNVPTAVRLSRPLNIAVLQQCVNEIVRRHEVFRTSFVTIDGQPTPVISANVDATIEIIDLTSLDESAREAESLRLTKEAALRSFDLASGPLMRTSLIRLTEQESIFLLTMHHIVSDGGSILIFFKELSALYQAFSNGQASVLSKLPIQYADYALWQRDWLRGERLEQQLAYWKQELSGELPVLELPTDRQRPAVQTYPGGRATATLSEELTSALNALSQREGATLFMTLLAAFKLLLHRYSGQDDIIIGSPIANRAQNETENLIGFFLNNLALRTDLSGKPTFRELLSRVRQAALDAYANQDVPFEKLIEELKPERDLSRTSIFQVYFNLFSFSDRLDLPDGESINFVDAWLQSEENLSKFDLTLYAGAGDKQIKLALVYNADLFAPARMTEMLEQFTHLLTQIVARPDEKISHFSLVTPKAQALLPNPEQPFESSHDEGITTLFSDQARKRSDGLALVDPDESWSYQDLDRRSNQLANHLRQSGIKKGDIVAIYGHRSAPLVWAILGVLKAGAAFTILDPAYPASRLMDYLRIASPRGWLQIEAAGRPLPETLEQFVRALDCRCRITLAARADCRDDDPLANSSTDDPDIEIDTDDLAYIAFTSGSTGLPKGVMGRHGPLTLFTSWAVDSFGLNERDRFCMLSGLAHDPLHRDIFTPLQLGGAICIPDPLDLEAPDRLRAWMRKQKISVANLTPAMSQLLTDGDSAGEQIDSLRYSFLVGDVLTRRDVSRLKDLAPSITCVNLFGSTETQRAVGHYVVPASESEEAREKEVLPLGKGIRDVQLLVLNDNRQLCGIGELGEIYFRSPHLAKGYLGDEQLTNGRFIVNPFTKRSDDRLYRTGDLGRYLPDGNVEHLGRADRQVKIRGFRIEPGEIEAALTQHPDVREAAVIAQFSDFRLQAGLIAYVVPVRDSLITPDTLRDHLNERLPAYMIPAAFVLMEALPLTPNGKLDRRALPVPEEIHRELTDYTAPRSAYEQSLTEVWQEVLAIEQVSIHDNFFELGGHSLLAVRLFAVMEKKFGKRLPLATLFQAPTIAQLAAMLEKDSSPAWSSLVPIQPHGIRAPFFCVHAVGGNVLEYYDLARHLGTDQPFYGLQSRGLDDKEAPHTRIEEMAAHYVKEIRELQPAGPYFIGGRSFGGIVAFEMACQLRAQDQEVALLALLDSYPVGHQKLSPQSGALRSKVSRGLKRMLSHVSNLRGLSLRGKLLYLAGKSQYAPIRIKSKIWRTIYRSFKKLGRDVPSAFRNVEEFNWLAAHDFVPRLYDGNVTLFWASNDLRAKFDQIEGWQALARGGMDLHEIPGTHLDIIKEPNVAELAQILHESLVNAQQAVVPKKAKHVSEPRAVAKWIVHSTLSP
jgi:amino acid adenylation domain-containing protein